MTRTLSPAVTSRYAERIQAKIRVDEGDGLAAVAGAVWVKTDDGRVVRVDPGTNRVTGAVRTDTAVDPNHYCQGIGVVQGTVWACSAGDQATDVVEVDPDTVRVTRRVGADKVFDQLKLPVTAGSLWVLSANGTTARRIDAATGTVVTSRPLGARCPQVDAEDDSVVATCATESRLLRLDPGTAAVTARVDLPEPRSAALLDGEVWVDTAEGLTRLAANLRVSAVYPRLTAGLSGELVAAEGAIWLRAGNGTITKIDPASGRALERVIPDADLTAGSLLVAYGSLWTTSGDDGVLYRLALHP
ncbi:MAG TPA: hypothetical protein VES95_08975 [Dermatophilaceae bacterium]|nr:hypothetical protein [Dermatophilaceae bacterium]